MKQLTDNLTGLFAEFTKDSTQLVESGNKAAGARARKTSLAIQDALKEFRKISVEASKK